MKDKEIRLKINNYEDRQKIIQALANSGYSVRVEETEDLLTITFFVIFNPKKINANSEEKDKR